jgi:hypothetical protein
MPVRFDDSLTELVGALVKALGKGVLPSAVAIRDMSGRLSVVVDAHIDEARKENATRLLQDSLGNYARSERVLGDVDDLNGRDIFDNVADQQTLETSKGSIRLIDRRVVGSDWLTKPLVDEAKPPRIVFASLKGGVGRSTALSVLAADYARRGKNVLAVDFDLEAPGIGSMLLAPDRRPLYGTLDFLVENGIGGIADEDLSEFVGTSGLTAGAGLVDVAPAYGTKTLSNPSNYMPKLSRAVLEDIADSRIVSLREQMRITVERLSSRRAYDYILIDARAGLSEITAGPILGLGATVLFFGSPDTQTVEGYRYLLATLANLIRPGDDLRWRERLKVVMTKGATDEAVLQDFISEMHELFVDFLYDEIEGVEGFSFDVRDPEGPHFPLRISFDPTFVGWDPGRQPDKISESFYRVAFSNFISKVDELISDVTVTNAT